MSEFLDAARAARAAARAATPEPAPTEPEAPASSFLEEARKRRAAAQAVPAVDSDRAPTVRVDALKEDLARGGALLATATRAERKREGASDEEADAAAKAITDTALVLGDNADSGRVREALAARVGVDTLDKAMTRAFGQRIMEVPLAAPTKAERQQKLRDQELENRSVEKGLAAAWKGEGSTERLAEEGEIRPWVEAVDRLGWNSGEDVLTSVFSGGLVPAYKLITNAPEIVKGYATDKDVQNLTGLAGSAMSAGVAPLLTGGEDPFSRTIRAMAVSSGLPDVTAAGMDALGFDSYSVSEFADNVHAKPEFDAAAYDLVTKGDRAAFEAVPFNKLPEMAKGELVDAARVREAIRSGKPGFEPLAGMEDLRDDVLSTQASFLPVSVIRTIQPDAVPDDLRIKDVFAKREAAKPWRGDDMGASAAKLMNSALLRPAGDGKTLMVAPGRFQELLRFANAVPAALTNVNIGTDTPVFNAPLALPRAALYAAEEAGIPGAENIRGKVEAFKVPFLIGPGGIPIPQPAAWESMIQSGEYDDLLEAVGMFTSDQYANRYDPESTWLSRTLTEIANPDAAGQYLGDTYERLGGDPESTTARVLGTADLAVNIGMPAEEMVLLPIAKATAATNRFRRTRNAARELGLNPKAANKAAKESVFVGSDPRQAVADSLTRAAVEGIRDGTLNPAKVPTATKKAIESVLRAAGMPEDLLTAEKGRPYAKIWDDLADRRARILETAADFETIGGPATQKLRASPEYRAVADQLDVFTRTRTMTPDEEAAVAADIAAGRVPKMTGNLSMRDRDLVLRFLEAAAFRAAEDGRVASPEDYFARHSWERGVEGEVLPEGTLLSGQVPTREDWAATSADIKARHGLDTLYTSYRPDDNVLIVSLIRTPKDARGQGAATAAMREITAWADQHGATVALSPSSDFGASKGRLTDWYKSLGFKPNKGSSRDLRFNETMRRDPVLLSRESGVTRGSISPGTPDTVNVPNPDYAAWEARVNALSAEVDALKAAPVPEPAEIPNPAFPEAVKRVQATDAEIRDLKQQASRAFGVNPEWTVWDNKRKALEGAWNRDLSDLTRGGDLEDNPAYVRHMAAEPPKSAQHVNNALIAAKEAELATLRANIPPRTLVEAPPVDDVLNAKAEALARLRRFKIPKEVPKPSDVSRWLIKLFRTGDVKTAFHEGTHLLDLMMGEEWTRRAMEALGYDPTGPITTEVRERIAEAGTRALRGTLRPGSQLGNVFEDFRDTIGDVWRRVKREPAVTTPAFRKLWDKTFAPDDAEMMVAAYLVDQHGTGPLGRVVTTSGNVAEEIREGAQRAAGMAENAANVMRANQEIRQALGLTNDMTSIAVGDLLGRALAYTATTHALRGWGFGDLEGLTARTAVPAARAKRIRNEVAMYRKAVLGGKEAPTPVVVDGREVFMMNRDQQAGVRRMLADLANEPVSVDLPERLQDPRADLSQITREEWANIADRQLEVRAGAGAWRDRLAERAAVSAGIRFGQMAMDAARNQQSAVSAEANALRDAFVTTIAADEYLNPAAREVLKSVAREIGESGSRVKNAVIKAMNNGEKAWADAFKDVAASLPPEVVPVEELRTLRRVEPLATTDSFDEVAVGIPAISRLFTRAPVGSTAQMVQEQRSLSILDSIGLRLGGSEPPPPDVQFAPEVNPDAALGAFEQSATRFDDAIADAGYTRAEVDDAMATVQEGIKRRAAVFDNRASEIMHAFAGSDDEQVFKGASPDELKAAKYRAYESWYTGDWADNLLLNNELGQAARGPVYDQGMAVLNVLIRLEAAKVRASLARRLADVGVVADPASFLRGGVRLDRPYVFGTAANDVETITGEAYKQDVMHYLEAFTGWKMTSTNRLPTMETEGVFVPAMGMRAASGSVNKAAASDALRMIQSWGMKMGKGSAWETITLPDGGQIVMPTMFREPIEKALADSAPLGGAFTSGPPKLGNIVPGTDEPIAAHYRAVNAALTMLGTAYQYSFGMLKTGLTTGMGPLIRPAFFMGNFIGGMGQLYQGVGAVKALEIMARPLLPTAEGRMTRAVIARMWNNGAGLTGTGAMMPAELGRFDAVGRWHSDQSLASGATRAGLNSSLVKTEFAQSIAEDIKAAEPTLWNRLMDSPKLKAAAGAVIGGAVAGPGGAVVGAGAFASLSRTWQDFFREAATGIDNYYRVSTYIGEVLRGVPEEQAAELARRVAFDYNNVTEFEKNYLRKGVLFYSFQRNNQNLFWWTLLNHPSRVMVQLRALRGAQQENFGEDAELFAPSWGEGRVPFRFRPAFEAGHADRAMQGAVTLTPRLSIADAVGLWQSILGMTTELDPSAAGDLASKLNPWIQLSFVMSTGQDIHWQRSIEGFNTIPNWFVEMDENLTGGMVVNDLFGKVPAQYRNPSQEGYPGAPQWIVNPDGPHSRAWWVFRQMTMGGAMLDTITAMQRADFGDTLIEGGIVQKGVDLSRDYARAVGREPFRNEPDTEMARSGLTEEEELGSWLGFKPVQVLDRDQALAPLIQRRESEQNAKMRTLKKEGERAYH